MTSCARPRLLCQFCQLIDGFMSAAVLCPAYKYQFINKYAKRESAMLYIFKSAYYKNE